MLPRGRPPRLVWAVSRGVGAGWGRSGRCRLVMTPVTYSVSRARARRAITCRRWRRSANRRGCGLAAGSEVEPMVMQAVYGELLDPRDPAFADPAVKADLLAREPDATQERAGELAILARKQARAAVMFFDFTFSADKSTSVLHASLQAAALRAEREGRAGEAAHDAGLAEEVESAVRAGGGGGA